MFGEIGALLRVVWLLFYVVNVAPIVMFFSFLISPFQPWPSMLYWTIRLRMGALLRGGLNRIQYARALRSGRFHRHPRERVIAGFGRYVADGTAGQLRAFQPGDASRNSSGASPVPTRSGKIIDSLSGGCGMYSRDMAPPPSFPFGMIGGTLIDSMAFCVSAVLLPCKIF